MKTIICFTLITATLAGFKENWPENEFYWIEKKPVGYSFDWRTIAQRSIEQVIKNMEADDPALSHDAENLMGINGLKQFSNELVSIEDTIKPYLLPSVFDFFYGSIETNGTGGAAFRIFYRESDSQLPSSSHFNPVRNSPDIW